MEVFIVTGVCSCRIVEGGGIRPVSRLGLELEATLSILPKEWYRIPKKGYQGRKSWGCE